MSFAKKLTGRMIGQVMYDRLRVAARSRRLAAGRVNEPEIELVPLLLRPGDFAVDVGAYAGEYSYAMSRCVALNGTVLAFEPHRRYANLLSSVLKRLGAENVQVLELALSDSSGTSHIVFATDDGEPLHGRAYLSDTATGTSEKVTTTTLDIQVGLASIEGNLSLVKIDVEGAELAVLKGAQNTLSQFRPVVICEVEDRHCKRYGHTKTDVLAGFDSAGYDPYEYDATARKVVVHDGADAHRNIVFLPRDRKDLVLAQLNRATIYLSQ